MRPSELELLRAIAAKGIPEPFTALDLVRALGLTSSQVRPRLRRLWIAGYLTRTRDDAGRVYYRLTGQAREFLRAMGIRSERVRRGSHAWEVMIRHDLLSEPGAYPLLLGLYRGQQPPKGFGPLLKRLRRWGLIRLNGETWILTETGRLLVLRVEEESHRR